MNINGLQSQVSSLRPLGTQLDITLNGISKPQNVAKAEPVSPQSQMGSIAGVLSEEENMALASMFQTSGQNLYTVSGNTQITRVMPGLNLDVQA